MAEEEKKSEPESVVEKLQAPAATPSEPAEAQPQSSESADSEPKAEVAQASEPTLITSEKIDVVQPAKIEKKPGLFKRLFKRKAKAPKEEEKPETPVSEKPALSQQEMSAKLAQLIDKQIAENNSGEFLVIRIRKQYFLLLAGLAILGMWLVALGKPDLSSIRAWFEQILPKQNIEQVTPESSAAAGIEPTKLTVRIKYVESQPSEIEAITAALSALNVEVVDAVTDPTLTETGYQFIAKPDYADTVASIAAALSDTYTIASSSSQLSADSDFDAVFVVGKHN